MSTLFTIEVYLETGDSFDFFDDTDLLGVVFDNIEDASLVLKYMKKHYEFYKEVKNTFYIMEGTKRIVDPKIYKRFHKEPWFSEESPLQTIMFKGKPISLLLYLGQFDTPHSAKIIVYEKPRDDLVYEVFF